MIKFDKKTIIGLILFAAVAAGILYLLFPLGLAAFFTNRNLLTRFITEHRTNAAVIFIGLQILQVIAAPVPGEVTGFVGGVFFGTFGGIVYSTIGLTAGSWLAFVLARLSGRPLVERIVKPATINRYDYVMKHKGMFLAFIMFLIPGFPKDILCYVLGLGHMGHRDFLLVSTCGRFLGTVLLTMGGSFIRNRHYGAFFTVAAIGIGVILFVMIYRKNVECWFRSMQANQRIKMRSEPSRLDRIRQHKKRSDQDSDDGGDA
jgi:uncharacterized membrane protein YdjX (TVP38/TMEM64 family)